MTPAPVITTLSASLLAEKGLERVREVDTGAKAVAKDNVNTKFKRYIMRIWNRNGKRGVLTWRGMEKNIY